MKLTEEYRQVDHLISENETDEQIEGLDKREKEIRKYITSKSIQTNIKAALLSAMKI